MGAFRYDTSGQWYKGNTHLHSTASDGAKTYAELAQMYASVGYDFLFRTDHWVAPDMSPDVDKHPLLWLDGMEIGSGDLAGASCHIVFLGTLTGISREMGFTAAVDSAFAQGAFVILAHPRWTGTAIESAFRWPFHGVETYNDSCRWNNGKGDSFAHWDAMLDRNQNTLAFAADDTHLKGQDMSWNGGWIVVNAPECTREAVMSAIWSGNFYSSMGPDFRAIEWDGERVHVKTSPVQSIRMVGPAWRSIRVGTFGGDLVSEGTFEIPDHWPYAYAEIEDADARRAWTNTLFVPKE